MNMKSKMKKTALLISLLLCSGGLYATGVGALGGQPGTGSGGGGSGGGGGGGGRIEQPAVNPGAAVLPKPARTDDGSTTPPAPVSEKDKTDNKKEKETTPTKPGKTTSGGGTTSVGSIGTTYSPSGASSLPANMMVQAKACYSLFDPMSIDIDLNNVNTTGNMQIRMDIKGYEASKNFAVAMKDPKMESFSKIFNVTSDPYTLTTQGFTETRDYYNKPETGPGMPEGYDMPYPRPAASGQVCFAPTNIQANVKIGIIPLSWLQWYGPKSYQVVSRGRAIHEKIDIGLVTNTSHVFLNFYPLFRYPNGKIINLHTGYDATSMWTDFKCDSRQLLDAHADTAKRIIWRTYNSYPPNKKNATLNALQGQYFYDYLTGYRFEVTGNKAFDKGMNMTPGSVSVAKDKNIVKTGDVFTFYTDTQRGEFQGQPGAQFQYNRTDGHIKLTLSNRNVGLIRMTILKKENGVEKKTIYEWIRNDRNSNVLTLNQNASQVKVTPLPLKESKDWDIFTPYYSSGAQNVPFRGTLAQSLDVNKMNQAAGKGYSYSLPAPQAGNINLVNMDKLVFRLSQNNDKRGVLLNNGNSATIPAGDYQLAIYGTPLKFKDLKGKSRTVTAQQLSNACY